ncbi:unnamed protein product [Ectocarpus sp. 12 AP-2014]
MSYAVGRGGGAGGPNGLLPEYNSIVGAWVLEVSRSETMEGYLRCMNVADLAIEAQMKAEQDHESRNVFAIEGTKLVIHKRTKINHFTQIYELDKEKITDGRSGPKHCMVSLRNPGCLDGLVLTTSMPTAQGQMHLVETRQLLDKGHVHAQELHLSNLTTGARCVTKRTWVRVAVTSVDQESVLQEMNLQP